MLIRFVIEGQTVSEIARKALRDISALLGRPAELSKLNIEDVRESLTSLLNGQDASNRWEATVSYDTMHSGMGISMAELEDIS